MYSNRDLIDLIQNDQDEQFVIIINGRDGFVPEYYPTFEQAREAQETALEMNHVKSADLFVRVSRAYAESETR